MSITEPVNLGTGHPATPESAASRLCWRSVLAVDIEGYSRLSVPEQILAQANLEDILATAAARGGLDRRTWWRQPAGDGELAVLPIDVDVLRLVADYPSQVRAALADINRDRSSAQRLRVRMAIHHGTLVGAVFGMAGFAPIVVSRLVDSAALRRVLNEHPEFDLALAVSSQVYNEIVESRLHGLDPASFHARKITAKGSAYVGYLLDSL